LQVNGGKSFAGASWRISPGGNAVLKIGWGGFFTESGRPNAIAPAEWTARQKSFSIEGDSAPAFSGKADFILQSPQEVSIGSAISSKDVFSGSIRAVSRLPAAGP
jgi:hypothetical protein